MPAASSVNLNRLAAFAAVVESGSFTAAAEKLGLTKAMVSQHVSRLEKELGIGLLTRTTRKVTPTETGAAFYADCAQVLQQLEAAVARVGGFDQIVAAAPAYLKKFGTPKRPEDLAKHRWIALTLLRSGLTWTFSAKDGRTQTVRISPTVSTNSTASLRAFMREGVGISILPNYMLDADIRACRLVHLLASCSRKKSTKARTFAEV